MIMNIVQFWLIDSIVKASTIPIAVRALSPRSSDSQDREPLFNSPDDDDDDTSPRDLEEGPRSSTSGVISEGDFKTLVGSEDNKSKLSPSGSVSGSSSPMTAQRSPVAIAHDYPPNSLGSAPPQSSTRPRHKYKRASSSFVEFPVSYSVPAVNPLDSSRNGARQAFLSSLSSAEVHVEEFDAWEKGDWQGRAGAEGWSSRRPIHVGAR